MILKRFAVLVLNGLMVSALILSCNNQDRRNSTHQDVPLSSIEKGEALAEKYCQSCHKLPTPDLLDSKHWEKGVLPNMGPRLGIFHFGLKNYPSARGDLEVPRDYYPSKPLLSDEDWQHILDYYTSVSPDSLPGQQRKDTIQIGLPQFSVQLSKITREIPATSFVKINTESSPYPIVTSNIITQNVYFYNTDLEMMDSVNIGGPVVDIDFSKNRLLACNIGVLNPNNGRFGKGQFIDVADNKKIKVSSQPAFDSLRRPVEMLAGDLNNDGKTDYLVCEFGNLLGQLSWMENQGNDIFKQHVLLGVPGAIKAYINDYNHDGLPDIWALFAQGDESIYLFTNKGKGEFDARQVLRFPPIYGSSYFELADFNKDGYPDIVYTCGDNADYSVVLKPYHGVYIFLNDTHNNFTQQYFFPIHGCYKAIARDFDGDGDLDLATISFFADYAHQPEEGFVYLQNNGNYNFKPYSFKEAKAGRWLTMDAGDIDGDGKTDLILGNFTLGPSTIKKEDIKGVNPPSFLVLRNTGSK